MVVNLTSAIGSFLTALAMKGESDDEILGTYEAVRKKENMFGPALGPSIDICGTGGEALKTFNISTAAHCHSGFWLPSCKTRKPFHVWSLWKCRFP